MHSNFLFCLRIGRCKSNFWLNSIELPKSQRQLSHFSESEAFEVWKKRKYFSRDGSTIAWEGILMRLERDWILMISEIGKICPQPYSAPLLSFTMDNILTKIKNRGMNHLTLYTCDFLNLSTIFNPLKSYSFFLQQSKWTYHTICLCRGEWGLTEYVSRTRNNIKYQLCTAFAVCNHVESSPASF